MEYRLLIELRRRLRALGRRRRSARFTYTDSTIVEVYLWAVLNDRPTGWACRPENWRGTRPPSPLPSASQVSRRLRTEPVRRLLDRLERWVLRRGRSASLACAIDGHALEIAPHSEDPHAGYGRGRGGLAKGYKLHLLMDLRGTVWAWRVAPMQRDEREIARRMCGQTPPTAYVLADANYDSNKLFEAWRARGVQLVVPRRQRHLGQRLGHRRHDPARRRSIELLEGPRSVFGVELLDQRRRIEGFFGTLRTHANGLGPLRAWVRTYARVRRWVQAKLILHEMRRTVMLTQ